MKTYFTILLFLSVFLCSCQDRKEYNTDMMAKLERIDSLTDKNPEEAINILDTLKCVFSHKGERAYYDLLRVKAYDKVYGYSDDRKRNDTIAHEAREYFMTYGNNKMKVEATYYLAREYFMLGDSYKALKLFQQAADMAEDDETIAAERKYTIHGQLSSLLENHGTYKLALKEKKKAVEYVANDTSADMFAKTRWSLSESYYRNGMCDSSNYYYQQGLDAVRKNNLWKKHKDYIAYMIENYLAWEWNDSAMSVVTELLSHVPIEELNSTSIGSIGDCYLLNGDTLRAIPLFKRSYYATPNLKQKISMGLSLMSAYNDGRHNDSLRKYVAEYLDLQLMYLTKYKESSIMEDAYLYKYQHEVAEKSRMESERLQLRLIITISICIFLILIIIGSSLYIISKKQHNHLKNQLKNMKIIQELTSKLSDSFLENFNAVATGIKNNSILTEEDWKRIFVYCNKNYPEYFLSINEKHPNDISALRMAVLKKIGFSTREIANIIGKSHSTVNRKIKGTF